MSTWYVRPNTSHGSTRNGTSYATAWGGWSEIVWGSGGVVGGDTLYVCGAHSYTANIAPGNHGGTSGSRCVIRGDGVDEAGSIAFVGAYYVNLVRSYTTIRNLAFTGGATHCLYINNTGSMTGVSVLDNAFTSSANSAVLFSAQSGAHYIDCIIDGNTFTGDCRDGSNATGAINWFATAAGITTKLTRFTVTNNTFQNLYVGRAAVHIRAENDTATATMFVDVLIADNMFTNVSGLAIECNNGHAVFGNSTGLKVQRNTFRELVDTATGSGGCMFLWGFTSSVSFGAPLIEDNVAFDCEGAAGLANVFYGDYIVRRNKAYRLTTQTIDACGVLFDFGCNGAVAYQNQFYDLAGKAGVSNSGVGIMVLDSQNVACWGNLSVRCRVGVHIGAGPTAQSCNITGNTFVDCTLYGIDLLSDADEANCVVKNNVFTAASDTAVSVHNAGAAWSGEDYNDFFGFASASGHTLGANSITSDPLLSHSYRPLPGSPLIGAGTHLGYTRDLAGVQRPNPPSIGAYDVAKMRTFA